MHMISCIAEKGRSAFLLKGLSKNKRKRSEIEEVKEEEKLLAKDRQTYFQQVKKLKTDHSGLQGEMLVMKQAKDILENLQRQGVVDERG
jgi:hypothetical protein